MPASLPGGRWPELEGLVAQMAVLSAARGPQLPKLLSTHAAAILEHRS